MESTNKKFCIVSHSHWDREWYMSHAKHNFRLVKFMDELITLLETDPNFKTFHLDGQILILEDYLAIRPYMEERIKKLVSDGRLKIGPNFILQDEYLISGEANIRNLLVGIKETRKYGEPTMIGYFPDAFGNIGQQPQILRGFGIDNALFGRGVVPAWLVTPEVENDGVAKSEIIWQGADGSKVIGVQFVAWYSNAMEMPQGKAELKERLNALESRLGVRAKTPYLLLLNGCDHQPVQKNLSSVLAAAKEMGYDVEHTSFEAYLDKIRPYKDSLATYSGEIEAVNYCGVNNLLCTASSRFYLKQASYRAEYLLSTIAEPLGVIASGYGINYDSDLLYYAWKKLLENYPHDSICGCSVDEVHREMQARFTTVNDTLDSYIEDIGKKLTSKLCAAEKSIVVVNCSPKTTKDYVEVIVDYKEDECLPENPIILDGDKEVLSVFEDMGIVKVYELPDDRFRQVYNVHRLKVRLYGEFSGASCTVLRIADKRSHLKSTLARIENGMENAFIRVDFNSNGTFNITDKATGKVLRDQNYFAEIGDNGNGYDFIGCGDEHDSLSDTAQIALECAEKDKITYRVVNSLMQQNGEAVKITSLVSLYHDKRNVEVSVNFDNECKNHRIRAAFGFDSKYSKHRSAGQFDVVERDNLADKKYGNPYDYHRAYEFIERLNGEGDGVVVSLRGNLEYEVNAKTNATELTLVRGVKEMGDWFYFPTEDSQCLRRVTANYSVEFYANGNREKAVENAYSFHKPCLWAFSGNGKGGTVQNGLLQIKGNVTVSCMKRSDEGETVVRFFNPYETAQTVSFNKKVQLTNMAETERGDSLTEVTVKPKQIVTVISEKK